MNKFFLILLIVVNLYDLYSQPILIDRKNKNSFCIVDNSVSEILVDNNDFEVVNIAAKMLSDDINIVSSRKPNIVNKLSNCNTIIIGTIGKNKYIDSLIHTKRINVDEILGKWEAFKIIQLSKNKLVVVGSDRRGTAYGALTLSECIGVSPWVWWADIIPKHESSLYIYLPKEFSDYPSVKYRGIFINDERYGLHEWARHTFDRELMDIGPKTYIKVFELMLRLKANYLWPAMHDCTAPFNYYPENKILADKYAIIMGSSHCEQMLCNNSTEWNSEKNGPWNFLTNRKRMINYWSKRVKENSNYENVYMLGLRGLADTEMFGAPTLSERLNITQDVIEVQRNILNKYIGNEGYTIPQLFCMYKEVSDIYKAGLKLPEDITLMWVDDNHGFIRCLPDSIDRIRKGGSGVYYHLSYHGDPESWLWLSSLSPSLISYELYKAYYYGANNMWMINVGDIKPHEKEISLVMEMAWNIDKWSPDKSYNFMKSWIDRNFYSSYSKELDSILNEFYRLASTGKPEHVKYVDYSEKEIKNRIDRYLKLSHRIEDLYLSVPTEQRSSFYQLFFYPIRGAALMNMYYLSARLSMSYAQDDSREKSLFYSEESAKAMRELDYITDIYDTISNGKWKKFMTWRNWRELDRNFHWPRADCKFIEKCFLSSTSKYIKLGNFSSEDTIISFNSKIAGKNNIWIKAKGNFIGWTTYNVKKSSVKEYDQNSYSNNYWEICVNGKSLEAGIIPIGNAWHAVSIGPQWNLVGEFDFFKGKNQLSIRTIKKGAEIYDIFVGRVPPMEQDASHTININNFYKSKDGKESKICTLPNVGYNGGITAFPFTNSRVSILDSPILEYEINVNKGKNVILIKTLPTQQINNSLLPQYMVELDGNKMVVDISTNEFTAEWQKNVLSGESKKYFTYLSDDDKEISLKIYLYSPGVVLTGIEILN